MITEIYSNAFYMLITTLILALAFDLVIGEFPVKIHPVVWVGNIINFFKKYFIGINNKISGLLLTVCVVVISSLIVVVPLFIVIKLLYLNNMMIYLFKLVAILLLSSTFSVKLLLSSAEDVRKDLENNNLNKARKSVSYLVSRDTDKLSKEHVISATIETLTENIPDSYVSTIFYYVIFGILAYLLGFNDFYCILIAVSAAFIHRIIDTLDSMVGYKTKELSNIGFIPAKIDDILNFIPARFSGALIVIASLALGLNYKNSFFILKRDAKNCSSPNSGYTMSAVAGALDIQLEKENTYILGDCINKLKTDDITKAIDLTRLTIAFSTLFYIFILLDILLYLI